MATKDYSFITNLMKQLDLRNYDFIDSLTEEDLKQVQPYTLMRWMSCVPDASGLSIYQMLVTHSLNQKTPQDKKLLLKMIASSGCMRELRHQWIAPVVKKKTPKRSKKFLKVQELLEISDFETEILFKECSEEKILGIFHHYGFQDSEIDKLLK